MVRASSPIKRLRPQQVRALVKPSDARGFLSLATAWGVVAGSLALVAWRTNVFTVVVAVVLIGGRQLGLAILMHECAHRSLFRTPLLNDFLGKWLIAAPVWQDLSRYRPHHMHHHRYANTSRDPDLGLVTPFPASLRSLVRKLSRDVTGVSAVRRIVALLAMDAGIVTYTAAVDVTRVEPRPSVPTILRNLGTNTGPVLLTNAALAGMFWAVGQPWLMLVWAGAYCTTFSLFVRIRSMAEHACMPLSRDILRNTRTTRASWLARLTVAPHHVNYHLEHHLLMTVPHYHLPALHRALANMGNVLDAENHAPNYRAVLRRMVAR